MAASCLSLPTTPFNLNHNALPSGSRVPSLSSSMSISTITSLPSYSSLQLSHVISAIVTCKKVVRVTALAQDTEQSTEKVNSEDTQAEDRPEGAGAEQDTEGKIAATAPEGVKLYVGNLPRSCDSAQLTQIFREFGTVDSVEVICNEETGISRGFAYVTMRNEEEAHEAIDKLRNYDLGGRDIIVNLPERVQSTGSGIKIYVGNLAWSAKRESIRVLFSQYGDVLGLRLNYDRKDGVPRVYGFVFLSTRSEVEAAVAALNGKEFHGRQLVVREAKPYSKNIRESDEGQNILIKPAYVQEDNRSDTSMALLTETPYRVYVGNLSNSASAKSLEELFGQYGNVLDARVLFQRKPGSPRVFGFVAYSSQTEVESAITALNGKEFLKRALVVQEAKVKNQA
ncbi:28 kDa ribonucleoprotein, chloroplastic isoform X1 [Cryptomeria japonica]|uniref:28 kDa ribonucleoprotein, chloroplastic isoform X1 n=1 Tax=Cryptomeria japonica TaxID=3369 RepID=UPI0027DA31DF|nr:28 kDa ribonucleoprotein, chloroplastic isoform X1 [Cryptomeria japonica]